MIINYRHVLTECQRCEGGFEAREEGYRDGEGGGDRSRGRGSPSAHAAAVRRASRPLSTDARREEGLRLLHLREGTLQDRFRSSLSVAHLEGAEASFR